MAAVATVAAFPTLPALLVTVIIATRVEDQGVSHATTIGFSAELGNKTATQRAAPSVYRPSRP
jgi:hypothetical protein